MNNEDLTLISNLKEDDKKYYKKIMKKNDPHRAKEAHLKRYMAELFPLIPATTINHFIHNHVDMDEAEIISYFLDIKEPTGKAPDLATEGKIARARLLQRERNKKKEETVDEKEQSIDSDLKASISKFSPNPSYVKFSEITLDTINKARLSKRRPKLVIEDYLNKIAFYVANELMLGNESLDNKDWSKYLGTHDEELTEPKYVAGFLMRTNDPLSSINEFVTHEPQWKTLVFSSARYCGFGVSISKLNSVFLTMVVADLE